MPSWDLSSCLERLAERNPGKTEADIQADVRGVLLHFDLGEHQIRLEAPAENRRRIDVEVGAVVIECKRDLRLAAVRREGEKQLADYLRGRQTATGQQYAGILTDGIDWRYCLVRGDKPVEISRTLLRAGEEAQRDFRRWLGAILATEHLVVPTAMSINERLGADSPACQRVLTELGDLWTQVETLPAGRLKRSLWAKLLRTALGTQFEDEDGLFAEHTYLVIVATLISHSVVGFDVGSPGFAPAVALTGQRFAQAGLEGVGEAGFFDWVLEVPDGEALVADLARRVSCFKWEGVDHDVLKALYHSVVSPETRHRLGEYYTPDWLAERMISEVVDDPLLQRVLDPACGSGTFVFHAVRRYLDAANRAGLPLGEAVAGATAHVFGMDLHPVAVILAQVTYLLAIGTERLKARPDRLTIPVYLGDSMRWEATEDSILSVAGEIVVPTDDSARLFGSEQLRFPSSVVDDVSRFDQLVEAIASRASSRVRGSRRPSIRGVLTSFGVAESDRAVLEATYQLLCDLHDQERNHVWSFYVRNQARPSWFARTNNRVDVLIGNPPWLAYRYMPGSMQEVFEQRARDRKLWAGGARGRTTQQDLSAFFVARSIELYLRAGGRFGFVMPLAALSRQTYAGFRAGDFSSPVETCAVRFDTPWDLRAVTPQPFPVPAAVVFGRRVTSPDLRYRKPLPADREAFSGEAIAHAARAGDLTELVVTSVTGARAFSSDDLHSSPYAERFRQGAILVPRMLIMTVDSPAPPLGVPHGRRAVRSRRSSLDKRPWKDLPDLEGVVEDIFVRPAYLGEHVLPFRLVSPGAAIIPYDGTRLLSGEDDRIDRYPGLAEWWRSAERIWLANRSSDRRTLLEQLDYMRQLSAQSRPARVRVVYSASGNSLAAEVLTDSRAVIEHKLYWGAATSLDEAHYLTAVLNAPVLTELVRPLQSVGAFGPRDFDKYVWHLPIPVFNPEDERHRRLVQLAHEAHEISSGVSLPEGLGFQRARRLIRQALDESGTAASLDREVHAILKR